MECCWDGLVLASHPSLPPVVSFLKIHQYLLFKPLQILHPRQEGEIFIRKLQCFKLSSGKMVVVVTARYT